MFVLLEWKLHGDQLEADLQSRARPIEQRLHGYGNGRPGIVVGELHRDVNFGKIVIVREVDRPLRVREVVSLAVMVGPGVSRFHVLERAPVLQQYLHGSLGCDIGWWLLDSIIHVHQNIATNSRSVSMRRDVVAATGLK